MTTDDLTAEQLAALAAIPAKWAQPPREAISKLPKPTKRDAPKGSCSECGGWHGLPAVHLDYMGHAETTLALCDVDPGWTWSPAAIDPATGGPIITVRNGQATMWAVLTVHGKMLMGVGTADAGKGEIEKELIGDFLRNAAQRFGIATALWSKADHAAQTVEDEAPPKPPPPDFVPPRQIADFAILRDFRQRIGKLPDEAKAALKEGWQKAGLSKLELLPPEEVDEVGALISAIEGLVAFGDYDKPEALAEQEALPGTEG